MLLVAELDKDEMNMTDEDLLSRRPWHLLDAGGEPSVVSFLARLPGPSSKRRYLIASCSRADAEFRPAIGTYVAMLDILGFSNVLKDQKLSKVKERFLQLQGGMSMVSMIGAGKVWTEKDCLHWDPAESSCSLAFVLDSIIIHVARPTITPLYDICSAVALSMLMALRFGWQLRGGLSYGPFYSGADETILLGAALIDAHRLEQAQEWSGCVLDQRAMGRFPDNEQMLRDDKLLVDYPAPMKDVLHLAPEERSVRPVVNWLQPALFGSEVAGISDRDFDTELPNISQLFKEHRPPREPHHSNDVGEILLGLQQHAPAAAARKHEETLRFYRWARERGLVGCGEVTAVARDGTL